MSLMLGTTISAKSCETAMCVFAANWRLALGIVPRSRATRNYSGQEVGLWEVGRSIWSLFLAVHTEPTNS